MYRDQKPSEPQEKTRIFQLLSISFLVMSIF